MSLDLSKIGNEIVGYCIKKTSENGHYNLTCLNPVNFFDFVSSRISDGDTYRDLYTRLWTELALNFETQKKKETNSDILTERRMLTESLKLMEINYSEEISNKNSRFIN